MRLREFVNLAYAPMVAFYLARAANLAAQTPGTKEKISTMCIVERFERLERSEALDAPYSFSQEAGALSCFVQPECGDVGLGWAHLFRMGTSWRGDKAGVRGSFEARENFYVSDR